MQRKSPDEEFQVGDVVNYYREGAPSEHDDIKVKVVDVYKGTVTVVDEEGVETNFRPRPSDGFYVTARRSNVPSLPGMIAHPVDYKKSSERKKKNKETS